MRDARVIHIVRNGPDNVASIYDATQKYPDPWAKNFPTLDDCIRQWNHCMTLTGSHLHKPNHFCVLYEDLVSAPKPVVQDLCAFLGLQFHEEMLGSRETAAYRVSRKQEKWKSGVPSEIQSANGTKFPTLFGMEEQARLLQQLQTVDLNKLSSRRAVTPARLVETSCLRDKRSYHGGEASRRDTGVVIRR